MLSLFSAVSAETYSTGSARLGSTTETTNSSVQRHSKRTALDQAEVLEQLRLKSL